MSFYTIGYSNKKMNFREYLFLFINEPNKIGELVRSIYYGTSKQIFGQFQNQIQKIISESENAESLMIQVHNLMADDTYKTQLNPEIAYKQTEFFNKLERIYQSYKMIEPFLDTNSNEDIFATQYKINEIPIKDRDKTMTKIISPPTSHECINCQSKENTEIFRQIIAIDFLNDMIKYATYFECRKCNKIVLENL